MTKVNRIINRPIALALLCLAAAWVPVANGDPGKSDLNGDGTIDYEDLTLFSSRYLGVEASAVDWCEFFEAAQRDGELYGRTTDFYRRQFPELLFFINREFDCDGSDLNKDGLIDQVDLQVFSTMYLELNWETVQWCEFYTATAEGGTFNGKPTHYYLEHFGILLGVIRDLYGCTAPEPSMLEVKNAPQALTRVAVDKLNSGKYYVSDARVGSVFVYDSTRNLVGEIRNLNKPLGVAIDSQGYLLVGNNGRNNIEVYDPSTGDRLATFGQGLVEMPTSIVVGPNGDIYVTDSKAHRVWVFESSYVHVRTIGEPGKSEGQLKFPIDAAVVARDTAGGLVEELYVADQANQRIQVFGLDGTFVRTITPLLVPSGSCINYGWSCPKDARGMFIRLQGLDVDAAGRVHILDIYEAAVTIMDPVTGSRVGSYGGWGEAPGKLFAPLDLALTDGGEAIVTDNNTGTVEIFAVP
jgi:hypothetical protein